MNINYQRSPKTAQFTTAKVSGNAWKQGRRTHSVLRQHSSQLQKYKTARISCRIAIDQKVCGLDGGHPGLTVWNLLNYTRIEDVHKARKKIFVFHYVAVICRLPLLGEKKIRACVSRNDQSVWNAISMRKLETKLILQAQVSDCINTKKTKWETSDAS